MWTASICSGLVELPSSCLHDVLLQNLPRRKMMHRQATFVHSLNWPGTKSPAFIAEHLSVSWNRCTCRQQNVQRALGSQTRTIPCCLDPETTPSMQTLCTSNSVQSANYRRLCCDPTTQILAPAPLQHCLRSPLVPQLFPVKAKRLETTI